MDLGPYASYRLPPIIATAFRVTTAQELADGVEATGTLTPEAAAEAEDAYVQWRAGDPAPVRAFLVGRAGLAEPRADAIVRVLEAQRPGTGSAA